MVCDLFARNLAAIEDISQRELSCQIIIWPGPPETCPPIKIISYFDVTEIQNKMTGVIDSTTQQKEYFCLENLKLRLEVYTAAIAVTVLVMWLVVIIFFIVILSHRDAKCVV